MLQQSEVGRKRLDGHRWMAKRSVAEASNSEGHQTRMRALQVETEALQLDVEDTVNKTIHEAPMSSSCRAPLPCVWREDQMGDAKAAITQLREGCIHHKKSGCEHGRVAEYFGDVSSRSDRLKSPRVSTWLRRASVFGQGSC